MAANGPAGHRAVPHTADVKIEAWAPTRERCVAEAVAALVSSFADLSDAGTPTETRFQVRAGTDADLLVAVLDEVIFRLETEARLPVAVDVSATNGLLDVRMACVETDRVRPVGAVPKAVALHELRFDRYPDGGWSCAVTVDV